MSRQITKARGRLTAAITAASTDISFTATDSTRALTSVAMADFGTYGYLVVNPKGKADEYEVVRFETWSVSSSTITVGTLTRGLDLEGDDTAGTGKAFPAGTEVVVGDVHHMFNNVVRTEDAQTVAGVKTFSSLPATTAGNPVADNDLARKAYVDATATGTTNIDRVVVEGTGGEVLADGDLVYLNTADGEWYQCDADTAATVNGVLLGIAQGAGADGGAITGGVLVKGLDDAQAGMTIGEIMYASNTAGDIANAPGTTEKAIGVAESATKLYFDPYFVDIPTADLTDALAGTSGTPSSTNLFVTNDDTSTTSSASAVARYKADGLFDDAALALTTAGDIVYSDGTDLQRLAIGAAGQVLQTNSGATAPEWAASPKVTVAAGTTTVTNTAVETSLLSATLTGGLLSTNNAVEIYIPVTNLDTAASAQTITFRLKYGATTVANFSVTTDAGGINTATKGHIKAVLYANAATNAQTGFIEVQTFEQAASDTAISIISGADDGTAAEDSTGNLTLDVTCQWGDSQAANTITVRGGLMRLIK